LSLGLTAIAAYQGLREAMADQEPPSYGPGARRLDASGPREVVYCHQCDNEWHRDEHGLICPRCEGEITEIVSINPINSLSNQLS
jgi:Zn finger protein HypA/HybF involved in hydrogenase expression